MAIINLSHRGDTFDKLLGHLLVFKKNGMHWKIY